MLAVRGVTLQYRTKDHLVTATYRVSFGVEESDRFVVLGPSGCGKSTLLKAVGGYMNPTEGEIRFALQVVELGIVVRDVSHYPGLANCLRITVGTAEECGMVIESLSDCMKQARG